MKEKVLVNIDMVRKGEGKGVGMVRKGEGKGIG